MIDVKDVANFIESRKHIKLTDVQLKILEVIIKGETVYTIRQSGRSLLYDGYAEYLKKVESNVNYNLIPDGYDVVFGLPFYTDNSYVMQTYHKLKKIVPKAVAKEFECKNVESKPIKILSIIGKSGTGKDTLLKLLCQTIVSYKKIVKTTTRPKRENEIDGFDYRFLTKEDFITLMSNDDLIGCSQFNNWYYGINKKFFDAKKINVVELNPDNIIYPGLFENLKELKISYEAKIIKLEADNKTRLKRCLNREENPDVDEIIRRYISDNDDFDSTPFISELRKMNSKDILTIDTSNTSFKEELLIVEDWLKQDNWL